MTVLLRVPDHARAEWDTLHAALEDAETPPPCAGDDRDDWTGAPARQARAADRCLDCPAMQACAAYARAAAEPTGTWGGLTARDRHAPRKEPPQ